MEMAMRSNRVIYIIIGLAFLALYVASAHASPTTTDDHNAGAQSADANLHLACSAGGGCFATYYRLDGNDNFAPPVTDELPFIAVSQRR